MTLTKRPLTLLLSLLCVATVTHAAHVELRIRAANPDPTSPRTTEIRSILSSRITTNDIISADGLEVRYDVRKGAYYLYKQLELPPKGVAVYNVQLRDVWVIPPEELDALIARTQKLTAMLAGRSDEALASQLSDVILQELETVRTRQAAHPLTPNGLALAHVSAFDANLEVLKSVRADIERLENLVLASGQDPGDLLDPDGRQDAVIPVERADTNRFEYGEVLYRLRIENPSKSQPATMTIEQPLPTEVTSDDIIDAGGLLVIKDPSQNCCVLFRRDVTIPVGEPVVFTVRIRDKWNINKQRIPPLRELGSMLLEKVAAKGSYASVEAKLESLLTALSSIEAEVGPENLGPEYVAFYRDQRKRLNLVEQGLNRIKLALNPIDKTSQYGFKAKPPSMKSTWLIIYIILGFLAVISLLFFLRWYGKTSSELMGGDDGGGTA